MLSKSLICKALFTLTVLVGSSWGLTDKEASSLALATAPLAGAAYCNNDKLLKSWSCGDSCQRIKNVTVLATLYDPTLDIRGYLGLTTGKNQSLVLSFRGAASQTNWDSILTPGIVDFNSTYAHTDLSKVGDMFIHSGFNAQFQNIRKHYLKAINSTFQSQPDIKKLPILVTGHSLGGALASLAALDLIHQYKPTDIQLITFAQPRVGNEAFVKYVNSKLPGKVLRVTHGLDVTVTVPPTLFGFMHFPQEIYFAVKTKEGKLSSPTDGEDKSGLLGKGDFSPADHYALADINFSEGCGQGTPNPSQFDDINLDFKAYPFGNSTSNAFKINIDFLKVGLVVGLLFLY